MQAWHIVPYSVLENLSRTKLAKMNLPTIDTVTVRVINDRNNKRKFEKRNVKDFPKYQTVIELKTALLSMFGHELKAEHEVKNIDIAYIGYSNKKYEITCDEDLKKAYESNDDPSKQPVFCMVQADDDTTSTESEESDSGANFI